MWLADVEIHTGVLEAMLEGFARAGLPAAIERVAVVVCYGVCRTADPLPDDGRLRIDADRGRIEGIIRAFVAVFDANLGFACVVLDVPVVGVCPIEMLGLKMFGRTVNL